MTRTEPKGFHNKDGSLTRYALACGYIERAYTHGAEGRVTTTLWMEGGVYHVRQHDYDKHNRIFWDTFDTLTEARKRFKEATKHGGS